MNRRFLTGVITCFLTASVGSILAQAPAQPAAAGKGAPKGGQRPGSPATPEDLADIAKLANLPAWVKGAGDGDFSTGPDYTPAPEEMQRVGIPHGKLIEFFMNSASSKVFPGVNGPFERLVSVYIPAQYVPGRPAPFIFSADSYGLRDRQLANILDNMIADRRLPVMVAVMVANGGPERSLEYDTVSPVFADFVETEILPRVEKETGVTLTTDPEGRMTYGGSSGGAMALTMAWFRTERYHRVLSYSGTFVDLREGPEAPHGAYEYPEHFFPDTAGEAAPHLDACFGKRYRCKNRLGRAAQLGDRESAPCRRAESQGLSLPVRVRQERGSRRRESDPSDSAASARICVAGLPDFRQVV